MGGNTKGSEGYGELTQGSLSRLWALLAHLRGTVLRRLHQGQWSRLFDLRSDASLCDVGSGYGKVVMHCALETFVRRAVGIECVISRHELAEQALQAVKLEVLLDPTLAVDETALVAGGR